MEISIGAIQAYAFLNSATGQSSSSSFRYEANVLPKLFPLPFCIFSSAPP